MNYKFSDIAALLAAGQTLIHDDSDIETIYFDSRKIYSSDQSLFIALRGASHNGHDYIEDAISRGIRYFIVSEINPRFSEVANFIVVSDTLKALQKLAHHHRSLFNNSVIGITGSNGKTMVKEWLSQVLSMKHKVTKNPRSYNSQLGVPLAVLALSDDDDFGIFEAGISQKGEMESLAEIIAPTISVFTNLGSAHDDGFKDPTEKLTEKLLLFKDSEFLIYCEDDLLVKGQIQKQFDNSKTMLFPWSEKGSGKLIFQTTNNNAKPSLSVNYKGSTDFLNIPFTDPVSLYNLKHVLAVLLLLEWSIDDIQNSIRTIEPIEMRYNLVEGINGSQILADMYSMDLTSFRIAVDHLVSHATEKAICVVFSDFTGSKLNGESRAKELARVLNKREVDCIIGLGENLVTHANLFSAKEKSFFSDTDSMLAQLDLSVFANSSVLLKGARTFKLESLLNVLRRQTHPTRLEIDLNALGQNLNFFRNRLKPDAKIMVMVKALSYGAGSFEIAKFLELERVEYLAVAFSDEGIGLRQKNIRIPILVLNPNPENYSDLILHNLEPEIYDLQGLQFFSDEVTRHSLPLPYPIHLKVETGMNRLGLSLSEISAALEIVKNNNLRIQSVFSHLAASDSVSMSEFTNGQFEQFELIKEQIANQVKYPVIFHILNSSGIINYPKAQFDMVRLGIGLYGFNPDSEIQKKLKVVSTLKSTISQIRNVKAGDSVGYNCSFIAPSEMEIAVIPVGYADGFMRVLGNGKASVYIKDEPAQVVGNICMDMFMADVTHIDCQKGDTVEIFGENVSINTLAKAAQTIPYEILSRISSRVPRVYYQE